jgi:large subunit ribosomal protein L18
MIKKEINSRKRRAIKIRSIIKALGVMRLTVHKTAKHIYAQIFTFDGSKVLTCASSLESVMRVGGMHKTKKEISSFVGNILAERALGKGILKVAFDRSGFKFHGRIKALADAARQAGLKC